MKRCGFVLGIFLIIVGGIFAFKVRNERLEPNQEHPPLSTSFIFLDSYDEALENIPENYVFKDYADFKDKFAMDILDETDFKYNNYVLVPITYDSCADKDIKPANFEIKENNVKVLFNYQAGCGVCAPRYMYYLLKVSKELTSINLQIEYKALNNPKCDPNVAYKPLIYLYPLSETKIKVKLGYPAHLTTTYPKYNDGWKVTATPDGTLRDQNGRTYYGLYWEGLNYEEKIYEDGFIVKKENLISFLEEKLAILGLNEREANEFIIYWLPALETHEYNFIHFSSKEEVEKMMPIQINPAPETLIRVFMEYASLKEPIAIPEQKLTKVLRQGYTVVEWGGSLIKKLNLKSVS